MELRRAYACFPSGVVAVCTGWRRTRGNGCQLFHDGIAGPATRVCVHTELVHDVAAAADSRTTRTERAQRMPRERVSEARGEGGDRFARLDWEADGQGAVCLHGAASHLKCPSRLRSRPGSLSGSAPRPRARGGPHRCAVALPRQPTDPHRGQLISNRRCGTHDLQQRMALRSAEVDDAARCPAPLDLLRADIRVRENTAQSASSSASIRTGIPMSSLG